jgi:hypothetical protein
MKLMKTEARAWRRHGMVVGRFDDGDTFELQNFCAAVVRRCRCGGIICHFAMTMKFPVVGLIARSSWAWVLSFMTTY